MLSGFSAIFKSSLSTPPTKKSAPQGFSTILKANPYRDAKGRWATKETATTTTSFADDMAAQFAWLDSKAKDHGKADVGQLITEAPAIFQALGIKWRRHHAFKGGFSDVLKSNSSEKTRKVGSSASICNAAKVHKGLSRVLKGLPIPTYQNDVLEGYTAPTPPSEGFFSTILKANPYHDEKGRFATRDGANFVSIGSHFSKSNARDKANHSGKPKIESAEEYRARVDDELLELSTKGFVVTGSPEDWVAQGHKVSPKEFAEAIMGKDSIAKGRVSGGSLEFSKERVKLYAGRGSVVHGAKINALERVVSFEKLEVDHSYLKLLPGDQGAGAIKKMFAASIPVYKKMGLETITLYANLDAGGYAWGRYGFKTNSTAMYTSNADKGVNKAFRDLQARVNGELSGKAKEEFNEIVSVIGKNKFTSNIPNVLTNIKTPELDKLVAEHSSIDFGRANSGKNITFIQEAMRNKSWDGYMDLTDKDQVAILNAYIHKK